MLIEFSVENYRSIKEEVTLSMIASKDSSLKSNLIKSETIKKDHLLKSTVIYGANASGKSNVLMALNFLKALVMNSHNHQKGSKIVFTPFKFDKTWINKPTKYQIIFIKDSIKYNYAVSFNNEKIIDESLYYYPSNKSALIFERKNTTEFNFTIDKPVQKFISERTLDNVLYLSKATQEKFEKTTTAFEWFKDTLQIIGATENPGLTDFTVNLVSKDKNQKSTILKALYEADLGIGDIAISSRKITSQELPLDMPQEIKEFILKNMKEQSEIKLLHKIGNKSSEEIYLDFIEESEGTRRIFSLIGPWIDALSKGSVLVVDELDTKLHHLLNVFLINLFHKPSQNKNNAQLIFTTHNTNLLDLDLFRRDQIWFTEKNPELGSTDLYSLVEFSPRKDNNIQKGYLNGRYGALPFIREGKLF